MPKTIETVIRVDENKYKKIKKLADKKRKSVSKLLEESFDDIVSNLSLPDNDFTSKDIENPLLDITGICNTGLKDASVKHDKYLYGKR